MVEQLTQRQAELAQSDNQIQLLEHHSVQAAEEIEVSHCHLTLGISSLFFCIMIYWFCYYRQDLPQAELPVLVLLTGRFLGFSPRRGDTLHCSR